MQKIRRRFEGSPTILILTDRDELNKQISDTFENCGLLGEQKAEQFIAQSGEDLRIKFGNPSFIFSLIQKFNQPKAVTGVAEGRRFDISSIDFQLLQCEFAKSREKNLILRDIQELLQERIAQMLVANPSRINFYDRYQEIIKAYNQEQNRASIEKTFEDLMNLSQSLSEEQKRYMREGFKNDEELALYELLVKDNLTKAEIKKLKLVAAELLDKLKAELKGMDHPFDKPSTKATIIVTIRDTLWQELPESYSEESIGFYRDQVYNFVSQRYSGYA